MTPLAWLIAVAAAWPLAVVAVQLMASRGASLPGRIDEAGPVPPFAVLIPARDEAAGIAAVIAAVAAQIGPQDRVLVVADNCGDDTAMLAARAGALVAVRFSTDRVGKAFALDFGRDMLRADPPAAVVILDADCIPAPGALPVLVRAAVRHDAAVQGRYLLGIGDRATPMVRISAFAFLIRNAVRQRGLQRLAGLALLQGSGMAMPWRLFDAAPLASTSLVEDLALGLDLALAGERVRFEEAAHFRGAVASQSATITQRTRWEHGQLATAIVYIPRLLLAGLRRRPALLLLAADLSVPPLAMLATIEAIALATIGGIWLIGGDAIAVLMLLTVQTWFLVELHGIWSRSGRDLLPTRMLLRLPLYVVWKQSIYVRLTRGRELRWIRTSRLP